MKSTILYAVCCLALFATALALFPIAAVSPPAEAAQNGCAEVPPRLLATGQRVVLLQDDSADSLQAGRSGTIVCCDSNDCSGEVLVSWDLLATGKGNTNNCILPAALFFPPGSATWVDPNLLLLGRPFSACGIISQGSQDCITLAADDGNDYTVAPTGDLYAQLNAPGGIQFGQRLRLQGLFFDNAADPNVVAPCPMLDGVIYHPILLASQATQAGCCSGQLFPADRVTLLVNDPVGPLGTSAVALPAGASGTVVCCQGSYGANWVFVSWDNWLYGISSEPGCSSVIIPYVANSGWWVQCSDVKAAPGTGGYVVKVGNNYIQLQEDVTAANPQQTLIGCGDVPIQAPSQVQLTLTLTATSAAGGTWSATITPDIVSAGTTLVQVCVRGENVDLAAQIPGTVRLLANGNIFAVRVP